MDPRVARTRRSLHAAVLGLSRELGVEQVTVAAVAQVAGINRSTFYQHFADKDELLVDALDQAVGDLGIPSAAPNGEMPSELNSYLQHVADNADIYRSILGDHGSPLVVAQLQRKLMNITIASIEAAGSNPFGDLPLDVLAAGISGAAIGVVRQWLSMDPLPDAESAARWLWAVLLGPGRAT